MLLYYIVDFVPYFIVTCKVSKLVLQQKWRCKWFWLLLCNPRGEKISK